MAVKKTSNKPCSDVTKIKIGNANRGERNGRYSHGMYKTKFYRIWRIMKNRCVDERRKYYSNINVCKYWQRFENFKDDMYDSYLKHFKKYGNDNTTIDRINNNDNYCFKNCRWATKKMQSNNRRNTLKFEYNNKKYTIRDFCIITNISYKTLFNRLVVYKWSIKRAINNKKI